MTKQTTKTWPQRRRWTLRPKTTTCSCTMCGTRFEGRTGSMYCSNACKQASYRQRHRTSVE